jgi:putative zinc finger protein
MSVPEHDRSFLGPYSLGVMDPDEARAVDQHLAGCPDCRAELAELTEMRDFLGEVPPEAFLDGPPEDGDLLLQRTLRQVRSESAGFTELAEVEQPRPRRRLLVAAGVIILAGAALGAGVLVGQAGQDTVVVVQPPPDPPGTRQLNAANTATGTTMSAKLIPKAGWVAVRANVKNLPVGAQCKLIVVDTSGKSVEAGSWLVSEKAATAGSEVDGSALVPIDKVKSIDVVTFQGQRMVSVPV